MCWLKAERIGPHLALLKSGGHVNSSLLHACGQNEGRIIIGSLADAGNSSSFGVGVVSAIVGERKGLLVSTFNQESHLQLYRSVKKWVFQGSNCWFRLQGQAGFNRTSYVCYHYYEL